MSTILGRLTRESGGPAAIVGSDAVTVTPELVRRAGRALADGADAAICPAGDGGYSLVAARGPVPALFSDVGWSSSRVVEQTLERAAGAGLRVAQVGVLDDIDVASDVSRLATALGRVGPTSTAVRTRHLISALGLGPSR